MNYNTLKELLTEKRINVPSLAKEIGMSKPGLYLAIEKERLNVDTLEKIASALGVPVSVFFDNLIPGINENKISELESKLKESEEKSQTRQTIINLVFQTLRQITSKHEMLMKFAGEIEAMNDGHNPDLEKFLNETISSLNEMQSSLYEWAVYINQPGYKNLIITTQDAILGNEKKSKTEQIVPAIKISQPVTKSTEK